MPFTVVLDIDGNVKKLIEGVIFAEEFDEKIKPLIEKRKFLMSKNQWSKK
jgi:hypothetical protein